MTVDTAENRQILIIGANGSGKTRFANRMMASLGSKAFKMSAIKALYGRDDESLIEGSVDTLYHSVTDGGTGIIRSDIRGEFDRLLALMLHEEMTNLIQFKYYPDGEDGRARKVRHPKRDVLPTTRLDRLIELWERVFPTTLTLRPNCRRERKRCSTISVRQCMRRRMV